MLGPTAAFMCVAWMTPACCCGPQPPAPGPPGNISGQVQFPAGTDTAPVAVYAVNVDWERPDAVPYLVSYLEPPATKYQIEAPPGDYQVVARSDTDPLSVGGYITCSTAACAPYLTVLRLNAGRNMSGVDIAAWGSRYAAQLLLHIDVFGLPIPSPDLSSPVRLRRTPRRHRPRCRCASYRMAPRPRCPRLINFLRTTFKAAT